MLITSIMIIDHRRTNITKITKLSTSPQEISNAISIFVKSCDQNVSSFWSHDFLFLSFGISKYNAYGRNYRQEKALDKDIRSLIVDTILSEGGDVTTGY